MRINVYTEELLQENSTNLPLAEIVRAEYVSSRTGEKMTNYGLRVFLRSAPELHYIPGRDDDRSAITFWCGVSEKNIFKFLDEIRDAAYSGTLATWRAKTKKVQAETEEAIRNGHK